MSFSALDISIIGPALLAGVLVLSTHVPLGREVLARGIIFIDLAVAQTAGLGVIAAASLGWDTHGVWAQLAAVTAALAAGLLLTWTERRFEEVQEAIIGALFVLAATGGILLLANHPRGGEELRDLLIGQILWVDVHTLGPAAVVSGVVLALWFAARRALGRTGFYLLFALAVTVSVQLVGIYLVFASLIVPALATRELDERLALPLAFTIGLAGYVAGLLMSTVFDLPTGAVIVWSLAVVAIVAASARRRLSLSRTTATATRER
ncbi:MAG: metal ABC transporter permease [Gammaproteobacteria bacterium]|nr:metal ABC transporter permease [Gammaproteobacteria bacterium]